MGYNASIGDSYYSFGPDVPKDRVTLGVPVITTDHSLIHEGIAFNVSGTFAEGTGLAVIGIKPPAAAKASVTVTMTETEANLVYTFLKEGKDGNNWKVTHVDPADTDQELTVTLAGNTITVSLATDEGGTITSLASDVAEAINSHPEISLFLVCTVPGEGGGVNAVAEASLAGGASNVFLHFKPVAIQSSINVTTVQIIEDRDFTGTAVNPMWEAVNQNRVSTKTSDVTITSSAGATLSTAVAGTKVLLTKTARGSAQGAGQFVASVSAAEEIVFKPGVQYLVSMARAGSTAIDFELFWYEEGGV